MVVSIPLEQGEVFRHNMKTISKKDLGFNPFGTGRGLSTMEFFTDCEIIDVSIPLEQGEVFRPRDKPKD